MSTASELLRELEKAIRVFEPGGGTSEHAFVRGNLATVDLRNALPELRAVVEYAEQVAEDHRSVEAGEVPSPSEELRHALDALTRKLEQVSSE